MGSDCISSWSLLIFLLCQSCFLHICLSITKDLTDTELKPSVIQMTEGVLLRSACIWQGAVFGQASWKSVEYLSPVKRICVFEHSVITNFNCACPAIQRGQGSGFLSEGSSWASSGGSGETARMRIGDKSQIRLTRSIYCLRSTNFLVRKRPAFKYLSLPTRHLR